MKQYVRKCFAAMIAVVLIISGMSTELVSAATARATTMKLDSYKGTVNVSTMNGKSRKASKGMRLLNGYEVQTEKASNAFINLDHVKAVKLEEKSQVQVRQNGKCLELFAQEGKIFFNVTKPLEADETLNVRSSTMVAGVRGTSAYITVDEEVTRIFLLEGTLNLTKIDPETGEVEDVVINGGEVAASYKYEEKKVDVTVEHFTEGVVPYFVLEEVAKDTELQKKIDDKSELSSEKLLRMKAYLDDGMTQEEAAKKIEEEASEPEQVTPTNPIIIGGWSGGGGSNTPPTTPTVPETPEQPGTEGSATETVEYHTDARFAEGYPKYIWNEDQRNITIIYKIADEVEVSEENPIELYTVSMADYYSGNSMNVRYNTNTEAVLHGHTGMVTETEPSARSGYAAYTTIVNHEEVMLKAWSYYEHFITFSVLKNESGGASDVPTFIRTTKEQTGSGSGEGGNTEPDDDQGEEVVPTDTSRPYVRSVYVDETGTKLYVYMSEKLDSTSIPDAGCFTVKKDVVNESGNSERETVATGTSVLYEEIQVQGSEHRRMVITLEQPITLDGKCYFAYSKPEVLPIRDLAGNEMYDYSTESIYAAQLMVQNIYYSQAEDGTYYVEIQMSGAIMDSSLECYINGVNVMNHEYSGNTAWYNAYSGVGSRLVVRRFAEMPQSVSIKRVEGSTFTDYAGKEYTEVTGGAELVKLVPDVHVESAVYNYDSDGLIMTFDQYIERTNSYGCDWVLRKGENIIEYGIRGYSSVWEEKLYDENVGNRYKKLVFPAENMRKAGLTASDFEAGDVTIQYIGSNELVVGMGICNRVGKPCVSERIPVTLDQTSCEMRVGVYSNSEAGSGQLTEESTAENPCVFSGSLKWKWYRQMRMNSANGEESMIVPGSNDYDDSETVSQQEWNIEKVSGTSEQSAEVLLNNSRGLDVIINVTGYSEDVYKVTCGYGNLHKEYYVTFRETNQ